MNLHIIKNDFIEKKLFLCIFDGCINKQCHKGIKQGEEEMKKVMIVALVAVAMAMGVYAEEAKAPAKADAKVEAKVCADCVKLNEGAAKDAVKKLCPACQKAADEAAKKAAVPAAK